MQIELSILLTLIVASLLGCTSPARTSPYPAPFKDGVDIAVNVGMKYGQDIDKLEDAMTAAGIPCRPRAMSLNAQQIVVERENFDRAKIIVRDIIVRDKLTVRVYVSADFGKSPATSLIEVWEKGKKLREEPYKLY